MTAGYRANRVRLALLSLIDAPRTILAFALAIGAFLRFYHLSAAELSNDEAASWASATVPTIGQVIRFDYHANPGKLAFHTILLHLWMPLCGNDVRCLRLLSAGFGTIALMLVYFVVHELLVQPDPVGFNADDGRVTAAAALSVLICAVMLILVRYSREARMYGLLLALVLAQMLFFLRARRTGTIYDYAAMTLLTALAIGTNMTALLVIASEELWLLFVAFRKGMKDALASIIAPSAALIAGLLLLLPFTQGLKAGVHGLQIGALDWIVTPGRWEPFASFESGTGTVVFPLTAVLAGIGVLSWWRERKNAIVLLLVWMWIPPLVLLMSSYVSPSVLVTRYLLSSFVPFFILAALGLAALKTRGLRFGALAALLLVASVRLHSYYRKPHDEQVREAVQTALVDTAPGAPIAVLGNERHAARYYFPISERNRIEVFPGAEALPADGPRLLILAPSKDPSVAVVYPHVVARFRGVEVREHR